MEHWDKINCYGVSCTFIIKEPIKNGDFWRLESGGEFVQQKNQLYIP